MLQGTQEQCTAAIVSRAKSAPQALKGDRTEQSDARMLMTVSCDLLLFYFVF